MPKYLTTGESNYSIHFNVDIIMLDGSQQNAGIRMGDYTIELNADTNTLKVTEYSYEGGEIVSVFEQPLTLEPLKKYYVTIARILPAVQVESFLSISTNDKNPANPHPQTIFQKSFPEMGMDGSFKLRNDFALYAVNAKTKFYAPNVTFENPGF